MLITTSNDLPGYEIVATQGEVFGLTVRSRNIGAGCLAGLPKTPHQQAYETRVSEWGRSQGKQG